MKHFSFLCLLMDNCRSGVSVFLVGGALWEQCLAGSRVYVHCELLDGVDEIYHALAPYEAGVFIEERVQPPLALVRVAFKVFVPGGDVDAVLKVLRLQERQQGIELVPVAVISPFGGRKSSPDLK